MLQRYSFFCIYRHNQGKNPHKSESSPHQYLTSYLAGDALSGFTQRAAEPRAVPQELELESQLRELERQHQVVVA